MADCFVFIESGQRWIETATSSIVSVKVSFGDEILRLKKGRAGNAWVNQIKLCLTILEHKLIKTLTYGIILTTALTPTVIFY